MPNISEWFEWLLEGNRPLLGVGAVGLLVAVVGVMLAWGFRCERRLANFTSGVASDFEHLARRVEAAKARGAKPLSIADSLPPLRKAPRERWWLWRRFVRARRQHFSKPACHATFQMAAQRPDGTFSVTTFWERAPSKLDAINSVTARYHYAPLTEADLPDGGIPDDVHYPISLEANCYLILEPTARRGLWERHAPRRNRSEEPSDSSPALP